MPRPAVLPSLAAAAGVGLAACSPGAQEPRLAAPAPTPAAAASHAVAEPAGQRARLVFFANPNGAPCQMQDRILREMSSELSQRVEVVYYLTTEPRHIALFQRYGVRSLPLLVVTDGLGRELRRATPGIQGPDQIRGLVAL
ncbi:MAG TPA: hypothetical protein VFL83_01735 [Anaeromyxobacter sp.]|nr:hypothetical protein [Anaeromyxobacter sp.]